MERQRGAWDEFVLFDEPDNTELEEYFTISIVSRMYGVQPLRGESSALLS